MLGAGGGAPAVDDVAFAGGLAADADSLDPAATSLVEAAAPELSPELVSPPLV